MNDLGLKSGMVLIVILFTILFSQLTIRYRNSTNKS